MKKDFKEITKEDIEQTIKDQILDNDYFDMGLRTPEQVAELKKILGNFAFSNMGDKIYKLPGGGYANEAGWKMFEEALKEQAKKLFNGKH